MIKYKTNINKIIGSRIRKARKANRCTLDELARHIPLSYSQLSKYERGDAAISAKYLYTIANIFNINIAWFYQTKNNETNKHSYNTAILCNNYNRIKIPKYKDILQYLAHEFTSDDNKTNEPTE